MAPLFRAVIPGNTLWATTIAPKQMTRQRAANSSSDVSVPGLIKSVCALCTTTAIRSAYGSTAAATCAGSVMSQAI